MEHPVRGLFRLGYAVLNFSFGVPEAVQVLSAVAGVHRLVHLEHTCLYRCKLLQDIIILYAPEVQLLVVLFKEIRESETQHI